MTAAVGIKWQAYYKFLAVFKYLQFPLRTPFLEYVLTNLFLSTIHTYCNLVTAVVGYGLHGDYADADVQLRV